MVAFLVSLFAIFIHVADQLFLFLNHSGFPAWWVRAADA